MTILYVNGDNHTAAAYAKVPYRVAEDDVDLWYLGAAPHPQNQDSSYGARLASILKARLILDTETGGTTDQIIAGAKKFIGSNKFKEQLIVVIGWPEITSVVNEFHRELNTLNVPHVFFSITENNQEPFLIPDSYIKWLTDQGFTPSNGFFEATAHQAWANHLIPYLTRIL